MYSTPPKAGFLFMLTETSSITFSGLNLNELADRLLSVGQKRLPIESSAKRPPIIPDQQMSVELLAFFSEMLSPELASKALKYFTDFRGNQPAALVYPNATEASDPAENEEIVSRTILSSANKTVRQRRKPKPLTSLPPSPLITKMANSLNQVRIEYTANQTNSQSSQEKLASFLDFISDGNPLNSTVVEFILMTKLAGIFDPETEELKQLTKNLENFPNNPVKIDACPSYGAGSLGQLMPQPTIVTQPGIWGDQGNYPNGKNVRFINYIREGLDQAATLQKYGLNCLVVTAEWELPLRPLLYQQIATLSPQQQKLFGIEPADLKTILTEYALTYQNNSLLEMARAYFSDVCRMFPEATASRKVISSMSLLKQNGLPPESFLPEFAAYLVNDWLLPNLESYGNIDRYLEAAKLPFTQYFFNLWREDYGIGSNYSEEETAALKRGLRLDYLFYRPQYIFENWLAAQAGFLAVFGNRLEEKKFYRPIDNFNFPKKIPFLPIPDAKLLDKI